MARLIEVTLGAACPEKLTIDVGDVLTFSAIGGRVCTGANTLELLGPFLPGIATGSGEVLSPAGLPNTVMFLARRAGQASIEVFVGDLSQAPHIFTLGIIVNAHAGSGASSSPE